MAGAFQCAPTGLALVAVIGWWDDHRPLPAWPCLLAHALAAASLAAALHLQGAGPAAVAATFVLAVVLVNAWNFMDGINGLAASQANSITSPTARVRASTGRVPNR